ncbi:MAG: High molecular weight rubredoxin [Smithella sp. SDB]|nr:MAG: High molecular weight rubredoxin [Smithella sp. SDB]
MNRAALHKISYGLYIVTSGQGGKFNGQVANSMFQVTSNPAKLAISINKENYTHELIKLSRKFAVSILSEATPMTFIGLFGFKSGRDINKLQNVKTKTGTTGIPIVAENTVSYIEVELEKEMDCGTHTIFMGNIVDCDVVSDTEPMTYAYYQKVKGGKSPKTAPTYIKDEPAAGTQPSSRYVCSVCGYVYDQVIGDPDNGIVPGTKFEDLPDSWTCPVCGADKSKFEKEK